MSNYWKAQKRAGVKEIFPSMTTIQKPGGGKFIKPGSLKGQKTVSEVKLGASKAAKDAAQFEFKNVLKNFGKKKK